MRRRITMTETIESLKKAVTSLKKEVAQLKKNVVLCKAQTKTAENKAAACAEELELLAERMKYQPRALEILDNLTIAVESDRASLHQTSGAAREFLDTLPADIQTTFRDWHPKVRGSSFSGV